MRCPRCNNGMIYDKFYGHFDSFWGWKCLICGELVDQVVLENRELMRMGRFPNTRDRKPLISDSRVKGSTTWLQKGE
jgi:hypothetical protein